MKTEASPRHRATFTWICAALTACGGGGGGEVPSAPPSPSPGTPPTISELTFSPTESTSTVNPASVSITGSVTVNDPDGDVATLRLASALGTFDIPIPGNGRTAYAQPVTATWQVPAAATTPFTIQAIDAKGLTSNILASSITARLNVRASATYTNVAAGGSTFGINAGSFGEGLCQPVASGTYTITNVEYSDCIPNALTVRDPSGRTSRWTKWLSTPELCGGTPLPMDLRRWGSWTYTDQNGNQLYWSFSSTAGTASVETALRC